jgi:predicted nuclease of restriction endonuclease-like (RecB) superfamily
MQQPVTIQLIGQLPIGQLPEPVNSIGQSPIVQFQSTQNQLVKSYEGSWQAQPNQWLVPAELLLKRLSYTHLVQLMPIDDPLKRSFYEVECIKGTWSVSALKRQLHSLLYERTGLSRKPEQVVSHLEDTTPLSSPMDIVKSVYSFEFLEISNQFAVEESELETALLDHLQEFLLELGRGFCLEARQQKILIGDEYFFIDLVFYHRLLKCHVLVDLKMGAFNHNDAGQLNTYLNYYKAEVTPPEDNPPVGILLVTHKNNALVQYATAGMDNHLFVSKYLVQLPDTVQLQTFIQEELRRL